MFPLCMAPGDPAKLNYLREYLICTEQLFEHNNHIKDFVGYFLIMML